MSNPIRNQIISFFHLERILKTNPIHFFQWIFSPALRVILLLGLVFLQSSISAKPKPKVLIVMSAANTLLLDGNRKHPTGVFVNELYHPMIALDHFGFDFVFATPEGKKATLDPESLKDKYWKSKEEKEEAIRFLNSHPSFQNPIPLQSVTKDHQSYLSLLIPGGQGLMSDLLYDENLPVLISSFHHQGKIIGLVCHAPALLTTLPSGTNGEGFLFQGYRVNSVTKIEEWFIETFVMKGSPKVRKISDLLIERGMKYESSLFPASGYATRDRNLVTSQNPFSGDEFTKLYLGAINEYLQKSSF
ncbi:type 1 glutamine amidotransferase domain-containing protein [Leptospira perdikensis]|uniref:Type 1 glutamine amidotransferase domain-containing protein n=1 Tax=Leptospira perdikensis TaxID=2484948 RepID=A0A4R9JGA2_9LEPT|nr:type 1 glutamine amidotransferase domain-containing protein [Leptospira perdikensis]TGL39031.1 type 1 glutamine amidotransferase domain-containing protein [Leptospira perdikensis]